MTIEKGISVLIIRVSKLEIAETSEEMEMGLMNRTNLSESGVCCSSSMRGYSRDLDEEYAYIS